MSTPLIEEVLNGKNRLLFTYGFRESGKNFDLYGNEHSLGLVHRSIATIFKTIGNNMNKKFVSGFYFYLKQRF
jgi:kinesin family protein 23